MIQFMCTLANLILFGCFQFGGVRANIETKTRYNVLIVQIFLEHMNQQQQFNINSYQIDAILNWIKNSEIAIPEIQRPFVWNSTQVRNLLDSLYRGYPTGYLIVWKNPDVRLKDGTKSQGKNILIDGQQRVTALTAAILGREVTDANYDKKRIQIAFNPAKEEFEVANPAIRKDDSWISDISTVFLGNANMFNIVNEYVQKNPNIGEKAIQNSILRLSQITNRAVGIITLESTLDIETVNVIFERVNSAGVELNQADFAMSKIAVYGEFGINLRKLIDYFSHLVVKPEFYNELSKEGRESEFKKSGYLEKIRWLKDVKDDLYDPTYSDVLRVAFTTEFDRGRISDLVSLLSGRNFETREYEERIQEDTFRRLEKSILRYINKYNFENFVMIIKSAGFIDSSMITSQNALNAAYMLYLKLQQQNMNAGKIGKYVQKWFVMSLLTGRYSGSPESKFDEDVKGMVQFEQYFDSIERGTLSDSFWDVTLVRELEKATRRNPFLNTFIAARIKENSKGFLSSDMAVRTLVENHGDMHHIFPKNLLRKHMNPKDYNQIANMVYTQTGINIAISDKPPSKYMSDVLSQCNGGELKYGNIDNQDDLYKNLEENCIPRNIFEMGLDDYPEFLEERRKLMAKKIRNYFQSL